MDVVRRLFLISRHATLVFELDSTVVVQMVSTSHSVMSYLLPLLR